MVKRILDLTPAKIIAEINDKFHISRTYRKAWHARTKALSKIFGD